MTFYVDSLPHGQGSNSKFVTFILLQKQKRQGASIILAAIIVPRFPLYDFVDANHIDDVDLPPTRYFRRRNNTRAV
jgi:hypothetical protein